MDFKNVFDEIRVFLESDNLNKADALKGVMEILKEKVYHYDWVGVYELDSISKNLQLGPFVGKDTDHVVIPVGKGVCGQVAESNRTIIVQDVKQESNYISCSIDVQAEIVVPIKKDGVFVAEIDIDSNSPSPFEEADKTFLESVADLLSCYY